MSILRYNERVASVFSFVAQVIPLHDPPSLAALEQRGVHKMLRLPPNSMSRKLMHSLEPFHCKSPTALIPMCRASMYRFARGESDFLRGLRSEVVSFLGDSVDIVNFVNNSIPHGFILDQPYLGAMLDALELKGSFGTYQHVALSHPEFSWLLSSGPPPDP